MVPPSALAAFDADSPPDELRFRILPASNGWIAMSGDPATSILNFTQKNINDGLIVFVHSGMLVLLLFYVSWRVVLIFQDFLNHISPTVYNCV